MSPPPPESRRSTPLRIVIVTDSTIYRKRDNETSVQALLQPFGIELSKGSDRGLELPDLVRIAESWISSTSAEKAIGTVLWVQYSGNDFNQASWETKKKVVCDAIEKLRILRARVLDIVFLCPKSKEAMDSYGMNMSQQNGMNMAPSELRRFFAVIPTDRFVANPLSIAARAKSST